METYYVNNEGGTVDLGIINDNFVPTEEGTHSQEPIIVIASNNDDTKRRKISGYFFHIKIIFTIVGA